MIENRCITVSSPLSDLPDSEFDGMGEALELPYGVGLPDVEGREHSATHPNGPPGVDYELPVKEDPSTGVKISPAATPELLPRLPEDLELMSPRLDGSCSSGFRSSPRASTPKTSHLSSDSELPSCPLTSSPLSSPPPILFDPYEDSSSGQSCLLKQPPSSRANSPSPSESGKNSPASTPLLASQSSFNSSTSSLAALPNLKGRDLFDSSIWADPVKTSVFYTFTTTLRQKARDVSPTPSHEFLGALRDCRKLVRCYTQNIDQLEERVGLATSLGLGPGSRARFSTRGRASGVGLAGSSGCSGDAQRKGDSAEQARGSNPEQQTREPESKLASEQGKASPSQAQVSLHQDSKCFPTQERKDGSDEGSGRGGDARASTISDSGPRQPRGQGGKDGSATPPSASPPQDHSGKEGAQIVRHGHQDPQAKGAAAPVEHPGVTHDCAGGHSPGPTHAGRADTSRPNRRDTLQTPPPSSGRSEHSQTGKPDGADQAPPKNRARPSTLPSTLSAPNRGVECVFLHGSLNCLRCFVCSRTSSWDEADRELDTLAGRQPTCPHCAGATAAREERGKRALGVGKLRPDIVLYGEEHPLSHLISPLVQHDLSLGPDMLLILGTSLRVHGLKVLVKEFAKAVHTKGGKVVFINYTKPPDSVWADVIDYWIQWDCDAWVVDVKGRKPALWLPPGSVLEDEEPKPAKAKRESNGDERKGKRESIGDERKGKRDTGKAQREKSSLSSQKKAKDAAEPARPRRGAANLTRDAKRPVAVRDDKTNGAFLTWKIMRDLRRIAGTSSPSDFPPPASAKAGATFAAPRKKSRKSAPAIMESSERPPKKPKRARATALPKEIKEPAPAPIIPDSSISAAVKLNPRRRKAKFIEGYELEMRGSRLSGAYLTQTPLPPATPTAISPAILLPPPVPHGDVNMGGVVSPTSVPNLSPSHSRSFSLPLSLPPLNEPAPQQGGTPGKPEPLEPWVGSLGPPSRISANVGGGDRWRHSMADRLVDPFFLADPLGGQLWHPPTMEAVPAVAGLQGEVANYGPNEQLRKEQDAALVLSGLKAGFTW